MFVKIETPFPMNILQGGTTPGKLKGILQVEIYFNNITCERTRNWLLIFSRVKDFPVTVQLSKDLPKIT